MPQLFDRIKNAGTVNPDLAIKGRYNTPAEMPLVRIAIMPGYVTYEDLTPLFTSEGNLVPATTKGSWGQLYAAGRI